MIRPKTIHILGAGPFQVPTIRLAKSMGLRVLVTDIYPERPGYAYADEHEVMDIADREGTLRIAEKHCIDAIVCDTTDVGVPTMAYIAERLGLPGIGFQTALNFTDKHRMRIITSAAGLPNPLFRSVSTSDAVRSAAVSLGFPAVVKPADNQGSRGVRVVRNVREVEDAYEHARRFTRRNEILVESFIDGVEVTVESLTVSGKTFVLGISDKDHLAHRPEVSSRITYPAAFPPDVMDRIRELNSAVIRALGLRTGITHAEYRVQDGQPYLIEIAARGGGSRIYSHIVPYLACANIPELYLRFLLGEEIRFQPHAGPRAANLAFLVFRPGVIASIEGTDEAARIAGVQEILIEPGVGERVELPMDDRSRPGQVIIFGETRRQVLDATMEVFRTVKVNIA